MIDWAKVCELHAEIGAEDFDEVWPLFLEEVSEVIDALRFGPDLSRLEEDLHFLKGSALNLGFRAFSELCHAGEASAAAGNAATVNVPEILDCFEASRAEFERGLSSALAA